MKRKEEGDVVGGGILVDRARPPTSHLPDAFSDYRNIDRSALYMLRLVVEDGLMRRKEGEDVGGGCILWSG